MATGQYIGVNGVARKVTSPYIGVNGVARNVKSGYVGVNGVARLFFAPESGKVVLEVKKVTADTYANATQYTAEEFILLDIYPKPGGTVNVTYGGLTKTITDTSGAEEPNAQQVFFGTFNGVSDSLATPESGELTIEGDCYGFGQAEWKKSSKDYSVAAHIPCITDIIKWGKASYIPTYAFNMCSFISVIIGASVTNIGANAFNDCVGLTQVTIPKSVVDISTNNPFSNCPNLTRIIVENGNDYFASEGEVLFNKDKTRLMCASGVTGHYTIPSAVTSIDGSAFSEGITSVTVLATTPPILGMLVFGSIDSPYVQSITVPKGCGEVYKAADKWSNYASLIVEAS